MATLNSDRVESTAHTGHALQLSLSNIKLRAMPIFALHVDSLPWQIRLYGRMKLYSFTNAAQVNVMVSLLIPKKT